MLYFAAVNLLESFLGARPHTRTLVCMVWCGNDPVSWVAAAAATSSLAFIHSFIPNKGISKLPFWDQNSTELSTAEQDIQMELIQLSLETLHFDPVLKSCSTLEWADEITKQDGYHIVLR